MIDLAYGMPGTGKSTLLHDLVRIQAHVKLFFVKDRDASWGPDAFHWRGVGTQLPINVYYKGDGQWERSYKAFLKGNRDAIPYAGILVFRNYEAYEVAQFVKDIGDATYVDDEIDNTARVQGWLESPLRAIVHEGRHLTNALGDICKAHIYGACRRPQNIHKDLTDIADQIYVFRIQGSRTLNRIKEDSTAPDEELTQIQDLPKFNFWYYPGKTYLCIDPLLTDDGKDAEAHIR